MDEKDKTKDNKEVAAVADGAASLTPNPAALDLFKSAVARKKKENPHAGHRKRLRESARRNKDLSAFSDVELVELLLSFFIPYKDTNVLAHKLLDRYGSVLGVLNAPQSELIEFPNVTAQTAAVLPALYAMCLSCGEPNIKLKNRADAADFFGIAYLGRLTVGTYVAFLDDEFNVIAIECFSADGVPKREIIASACKYYCKYLFVARRELDLFPQTFNIAEAVGSLAQVLSDIGMCMLDYLIFTDYGYYTVGSPTRGADWYPLYIFVPAVSYVRAPSMYGTVASGGTLYAGRETAEPPADDFAVQLCAAVKT